MLIESLILKIITFFIFDVVCLGKNGLIVNTGFYYSNLILGFVFLLTIITSIKYCILRINLQSKSKFKYIYALLTIAIVLEGINAIYFYLPNYHTVGDWYTTQNMLDFILIPNYYDICGINIMKMTELEAVFSVILVILAIIREKTKNGKIGYIAERILKLCFRYNVVFTFFIYISCISSKFLTVAIVKNLGMAFFALMVVVVAIKYYLAIRSCDKKNKEKYGKENLIVVLTQTNCVFSLADEYVNPLHIFKKYNIKNVVNSLLISGKNYSFVSYDAIRYGLIDIEQYTNIAYLIILTKNAFVEAENSDSEGVNILEKKIEEIEKSKKNFIIYSSRLSRTYRMLPNRLKRKYVFKYKEKINTKDVLSIATLKQNDDILKANCKKILDFIEDVEIEHYVIKELNIKGNELTTKKNELKNKLNNIEDIVNENKAVNTLRNTIKQDKNSYPKYALNDILDSFNSIEYFYDLLKMGEYIIHYMALKYILDNPEEVSKRVNPDKIKQGMLETWRNCIDYDTEYSKENTDKICGIVSEQDIVNSINNLRKVIGKDKEEKNKCTFKNDICQIISDIRNKLVAHGVITYSVSENIVSDLFNVVFALVKEFENLDIDIEEDKKIKYIFEKEIQLAYKKGEKLFLYAYSNYSKEKQKYLYQEYLNYETGKCEVNDSTVQLNMELKYSIDDIETDLERWVIK